MEPPTTCTRNATKKGDGMTQQSNDYLATLGDDELRFQEVEWEGAHISNRLSIWPDYDLPGYWRIEGRNEGQNGLGNKGELLELAFLIIDNLADDTDLDILREEFLECI